MRRVITGAMISLDGVMQAPGGPEEDPTGGFRFGGWVAPLADDPVFGEEIGKLFGQPFDLLLGRRTYDIFAAYWPYSQEPGAAELNAAGKYVASRTLAQVDWENSQLLKGDVAQAIARLKKENGPELQVHGSANLIQTLLRHGLIDELRVWIFPVVLGRGKRLFAEGTVPAGLELVDSKTASTGVVFLTYRPAGEPRKGSLATGEPSAAELERRKRLGD